MSRDVLVDHGPEVLDEQNGNVAIYVFIGIQASGREDGIVARVREVAPGYLISAPLVTLMPGKLDALMETAAKMAAETKRPIILVKYTKREILRVINPPEDDEEATRV